MAYRHFETIKNDNMNANIQLIHVIFMQIPDFHFSIEFKLQTAVSLTVVNIISSLQTASYADSWSPYSGQ